MRYKVLKFKKKSTLNKRWNEPRLGVKGLGLNLGLHKIKAVLNLTTLVTTSF